MASIINAATSGGLITTADTSGILQLQTAGTTAVTVDASQNVTFVGSQTLSGGTANGVTYLNGSKVLTSGSALTFDGTNLGVGAAIGTTSLSNQRLLITGAAEGATTYGMYVHNDSFSAGRARISMSPRYSFAYNTAPYIESISDSTSAASLIFGYTTSSTATEGMRLTSTGLGIGTSSPTRKLDVATAGTSYIRASNTTNSVNVDMYAATAVGGFGTQSNHPVDFFTNNTDRVRIDTSGNLLVGATGLTQNASYMGFSPANGFADFGHINGSSSGLEYIKFLYNATKIGSITQSGTTAVLYNVTSDQRLKENIVDAPEFGSVIDSIKVRSFDWITDQTHQRAGFIAQELVTVAPEAVNQPNDPEDMMAVDYSKLVPMLVKEVQSLRARVAQLESN